VRLFSVMPSARTRGNGHKLKHRKLALNIRNHFFYCEGDRLLREVVESPSLEILKSRLDTVLGNWL